MTRIDIIYNDRSKETPDQQFCWSDDFTYYYQSDNMSSFKYQKDWCSIGRAVVDRLIWLWQAFLLHDNYLYVYRASYFYMFVKV